MRVDFIVEDLTATDGEDYGRWQGNVIFEPGQSEVIIALPVYADTQVEGDETFRITLLAAGDTTITDDIALGTILNDDVAGPAQPTLSINDVTVTEGAGLGGGEFMDAFVSSGSGGLDVPRKMIFGPDGHLYVGSNLGVYRYDGQTGAPMPTPLNHGATFVTDKAGGVNTFNDIAFGPDDNLYALGDGIHRFNPIDGSYIDEFISADELFSPLTMFFGGDGLLYVLIDMHSLPDEIRRFDAITGEFVDILIGDDSLTTGVDETGGLIGAQDAIIGPDGDLYIVNDSRDDATAGVMRYDGTTGEFLGLFASVPAPRLPRSLSFSADGNDLFVADRLDEAVLRFNAATGAYIDDFVTPGSGGLDDVGTLQVGPDGNLYVASVGTDEILRFAGPAGTLASFTVTRTGDASGEVTVDFMTVDESASALLASFHILQESQLAMAGEDYSATSGTLIFGAGVTQRTIVVPILGDTIAEADETFQVILNNASGALIGDGSGEATIENDDAALADLGPATISGWDSPIVVSTVTGTNTDATSIESTDTLFIDLGVANFGTLAADPFTVQLLVDGAIVASPMLATPLGAGQFTFEFQDIAIGTLSEGNHTLQMIIDSGNDVDEGILGGEDNNLFQKVITVGSTGSADLAPAFIPGVWDSSVVISTETGTNTSATNFFVSDDIYVDLGIGNFGDASAAPFSVTLLLDGVEFATFDRTTPLNVNSFVSFEDISLGNLSAGPHTLEMIIDSGDDVIETTGGGENNNSFSRTIAVFEPATLSGVKWNDTNGDGNQDVGEDLLQDFVVYLDLNENGMRDVADEPFAVTNALGEYEFTDLAPGTYTVSVEYPSGKTACRHFQVLLMLVRQDLISTLIFPLRG